MLLALSASSPGQAKTPAIWQLARDVEAGASAASLPDRIRAAFDASLEGRWFFSAEEHFQPTVADDPIRLIRALKRRVMTADSSELPALRHAWRVLSRRVFELRVPPPPALNAKVAEHLDYPTSTQEFAMVEIVTALLESTVDVWLTLDLGSSDALARVMKDTAAAQEDRDAADTANDRLRLGDVESAYDQVVGMCVDLMSVMNLTKA